MAKLSALKMIKLVESWLQILCSQSFPLCDLGCGPASKTVNNNQFSNSCCLIVDSNQVLNLPEIFPNLLSSPSSPPGPSVRWDKWSGNFRNARRGSRLSGPKWGTISRGHKLKDFQLKIWQISTFSLSTCMWVCMRKRLRKVKSLWSGFSMSTTPQGY